MIRLLMLAAGIWVLNYAGAFAAPGLPPAGAPGEPVLYTVRLGESLSAIARDELGDVNRWQELAKLNNLTPPYVISPGQQLAMPSDYK